MERLTIDEIIEHCKRQTDGHERRMSAEQYETADMLNFFVQEYWEHRQVAEYLEELKYYRKAEEQGLLLRLPCKVGDTVFLVQRRRVYERKVSGFSVTSNNRFVVHMQDCEMDNATFPVERFGETVFLTREESESALAEKGGAE